MSRVSLSLLAVSLWILSPTAAQQVDAPAAALPCPKAPSAGFPFTERDSLRRTWYSRRWQALGERGLCQEVGSAKSVFRFTFIPSFHPSVVVIVRSEGGRRTLRAKRLSGAGGYEPGHIVADTSFEVSKADWGEFSRLIEQSGFFSQQGVASGGIGYDGAQWILEWAGGGKYYNTDRWTPYANGPVVAFRRLGEWLLHRSGLIADSLVAGY